MVKWREKSVGDLTRAELQYALEDAVEALTLQERTVQEGSLYRGLMFGLLAGAVLTALSIGIAVSF